MSFIYNNFVEYFSNPTLKKIKIVETLSIYCVKIYSMLQLEKKYLIVMTHNDPRPIGSLVQLSSLNWDALQTKILKTDYDVPTHNYDTNKNMEFFKQVLLKKSEEEYICANMTISIKTRIYDTTKLYQAIELYNTTLARD